jgi:hypothetical protein
MKRLILFTMGIILVGAIGGNSFEFAEKQFGPLEPGNVRCDHNYNIVPYSDLIFEDTPKGDSCLIRYATESKVVDLEGGGVKSTGTSVTVSSEYFKDPKLLKRKRVNYKNFKYVREGITISRKSGKRHESAIWISEKYYIEILEMGDPLVEADYIFNYYLEKYPPTYTVTASDLDPRRINEYELERHMEIIEKGEKYRHLLRSKQDKFVGTMAQCHEEAWVRCASGLCEDAYIDPNETPAPGRRKHIGCPIAMNFDSSERKELWKGLEQRALASDRLDFNIDTWTCSFIGLHWYHRDVLVKLGFTKPELLLMYKVGVPKGFLPEDTELLFFIAEPLPEP